MTPNTLIRAVEPTSAATPFRLPHLRGAPRQLLLNHDHECILCGGADCGKTVAACTKLIMLCTDPSRVIHAAMGRKTFHSIHSSCGQTFKRLLEGLPVRRYGSANYTDRWVFPNGSQVVCAGLDDPDKLLSAEFGTIYICQAEQLTEHDWEMILTRCTGRGTQAAFPQVFGDCNPGGAHHWIRQRADAGKLTLLNATQRDNPQLYDDDGNITPEGIKRIERLESTLTGIRRERLLLGRWASVEGAVYDMFNPQEDGPHVHKIDAATIVKWYLAIDEGYTNPCAILLVGEDSDGRWYVSREFYKTGVAEIDIVAQAENWYKDMKCQLVAVDAAAASLISALKNRGMNTVGGKGRIIDGIHKIQNRLKTLDDGKSRLVIDPSCENTIGEFERYQWMPGKDIPYDRDNHSLGALRYLVDALNRPPPALRMSAENKAKFYATVAEHRKLQRWLDRH
jgi:PBSX family phage terminase large subunit